MTRPSNWYHLKENLYKVSGAQKRLAQAEACLWQGQLNEAQALCVDCPRKQARNFEAYLDKHRVRIINYAYYQAEQLCSIGSGAVESVVKQIDRRLQIAGAKWNLESVKPMLQLRCVYLNGQLAFQLFLHNWDALVYSSQSFGFLYLNPDNPFLFPGLQGNGHIGREPMQKVLKKACKKLGIMGASTHSWRRTALTEMYRRGVPLKIIQKISGHSSLAALQFYLEVDREQVEATVICLPSLFLVMRLAFKHEN